MLCLNLKLYEESDIWTNLAHSFNRRDLLQLPGSCSLCISRDVNDGDRWHNANDTSIIRLSTLL